MNPHFMAKTTINLQGQFLHNPQPAAASAPWVSTETAARPASARCPRWLQLPGPTADDAPGHWGPGWRHGMELTKLSNLWWICAKYCKIMGTCSEFIVSLCESDPKNKHAVLVLNHKRKDYIYICTLKNRYRYMTTKNRFDLLGSRTISHEALAD